MHDEYECDRAMAAECERNALLMQAMREHESNITVELRRYIAEVDRINNVCNLRTHNPSVPYNG